MEMMRLAAVKSVMINVTTAVQLHSIVTASGIWQTSSQSAAGAARRIPFLFSTKE
jgi:hypothetical protein